jgi:hypothetical protein
MCPLSQLARCDTSVFEHSVWDRVGFYMIHTFLNPSFECQVKSFLKLIISFLVLPILVLSFKSCYHMLPQLGMLHLTLCVYLRLANWPSAQFANSSQHEQPSSFKNDPQASGTGTAFLQVKEGY